jgi:hypothetical protein
MIRPDDLFSTAISLKSTFFHDFGYIFEIVVCVSIDDDQNHVYPSIFMIHLLLVLFFDGAHFICLNCRAIHDIDWTHRLVEIGNPLMAGPFACLGLTSTVDHRFSFLGFSRLAVVCVEF